MKKSSKILVLSHKRWGKDTFGEILRDEFGISFKSSSQAAADIFIYNELKDVYDYKTSEECFKDRFNHRGEWFRMISDYNKGDKARLAKEILKINDLYIGMRDKDEVEESIRQGLFDLIVWIDASKRLEEESSESFNIDMSYADIIVDNNIDLNTFRKRVIRLGNMLYNEKSTLGSINRTLNPLNRKK